MQDEYPGYVYRQNRCAISELANVKMHLQCEKALETAKKEHDDTKVLEICSGLYALENEIILYGKGCKDASVLTAYRSSGVVVLLFRNSHFDVTETVIYVASRCYLSVTVALKLRDDGFFKPIFVLSEG